MPRTDEDLWRDFATCRLTPAAFGHREHLRVAYLLLARHPFEAAYGRMETGLRRLLAHFGAPASAYHETLTRAWLLAVAHFVRRSGWQANSEEFLSACDCLLDKGIMHAHYRPEVLYSELARSRFVEPDLQPIPRDVPPPFNRQRVQRPE